MLEADLFEIFIKPLEHNCIIYMTTGSVGAMLFGRPRMTHDIDLVLNLSSQDSLQMERFFPAGLFYCPPIESIRTEIVREVRGHFNIIHLPTGFKADIYPVGGDELMRWGLQHRKKMKLGEAEVMVAPPEYIIIQKLRYFQEGGSAKHLADIASMLEISASQIKMDVLWRYINKFNLENEWKQVGHHENF